MKPAEGRVSVLVDADRSGWRSRAACSSGGVDPELFFPVGSGGQALRQVIAAKAVCGRCPVITPCLMWALDRGENGVWGGMNDDERRAIRRRVGRTPSWTPRQITPAATIRPVTAR